MLGVVRGTPLMAGLASEAVQDVRRFKANDQWLDRMKGRLRDKKKGEETGETKIWMGNEAKKYLRE
jgi:hypothetical protein